MTGSWRQHPEIFILPYQIFTIVVNLSLFIVEIVTAHICHSLLLNADAMYRISQAILTATQIVSSKFFHVFTEQNTYGLARVGLIAELINSIFFFAMMISIILEAIKHILDNATYNHLVASDMLSNATRPSLVSHQHFKIFRADILMYTGMTIVFLNLIQVTFLVLTKALMRFNARNRYHKVNENYVSFKFAATASDVLSREGFLLQVFCQIFGSLLVLICGIAVYYSADSKRTGYVDPTLTFILIINCVITMQPTLRGGIKVLIQNFPGSLSLDDLKDGILSNVSGAINVHDLHVWQHIPFSYVATMHVVFQNSDNYKSKIRSIAEIMFSQDIYHFTIQPEFAKTVNVRDSRGRGCLIRCPSECEVPDLQSRTAIPEAVNELNSSQLAPTVTRGREDCENSSPTLYAVSKQFSSGILTGNHSDAVQDTTQPSVAQMLSKRASAPVLRNVRFNEDMMPSLYKPHSSNTDVNHSVGTYPASGQQRHKRAEDEDSIFKSLIFLSESSLIYAAPDDSVCQSTCANERNGSRSSMSFKSFPPSDNEDKK